MCIAKILSLILSIVPVHEFVLVVFLFQKTHALLVPLRTHYMICAHTLLVVQKLGAVSPIDLSTTIIDVEHYINFGDIIGRITHALSRLII